MMRFLTLGFVAVGLMACAPPIPDSTEGVGFENYDTYLARKQAEQAELAQRGPGTSVQAPARVTPTDASPEATAAAAVITVRGTPSAANPQATTGQPVQTASVRVDPNNPTISDEQDFQAVSTRETIQSDAERRQAQSAQYKVIAPTALPNRPSGTVQTPIQFALATRHPVGQRVYGRGLTSKRKFQSACARYDTDEKAQDQFLKNGGPDKDKLGLDPDGDGYACNWNPATYRGLVRNSG